MIDRKLLRELVAELQRQGWRVVSTHAHKDGWTAWPPDGSRPIPICRTRAPHAWINVRAKLRRAGARL